MSTPPRIVAFIFARGGSKGLPRKNVRLLGGRPLIAYSIDVARATPGVSRVVVSTEDEEIAEIASRCGAEVPFMRPPELARDDTPEVLAWQHAIETLRRQEDGAALDVFLSLPPTAPLRAVEDVRHVLDAFAEGGSDAVLCVTEPHRNPYFNMVKLDDNGYARPVIEADKPVVRRQDAPPVFDVTTVAYALRPDYVMSGRDLFAGRVRVVTVPLERAVDIDTEFDLRFAEFLLTQEPTRTEAPAAS